MKNNEEKTTINDYRLKLLKNYGIQVMPSSESDQSYVIYRYGEYIGEVYYKGESRFEQYLKSLIDMTKFISNYWWDHEENMYSLIRSIAINYADDTITTEDVQEYLRARLRFLNDVISSDCHVNCVTTWKCIHFMGSEVKSVDIDEYIQELLSYFRPNWAQENILAADSLQKISKDFFFECKVNLEKDDFIINNLINSTKLLYLNFHYGLRSNITDVSSFNYEELSESKKIQILLAQFQFKRSSLESDIDYFNTLLAVYLTKADLISENFASDYEFFKEIIYWKTSGEQIILDDISDPITKMLLVDLGIKLLEDTGQKVPESNSELMQAIIFKNYLNQDYVSPNYDLSRDI